MPLLSSSTLEFELSGSSPPQQALHSFQGSGHWAFVLQLSGNQSDCWLRKSNSRRDTCFMSFNIMCRLASPGDHPLRLTFSIADTTSGYNLSCLWSTVCSPPTFFLFDAVHACKTIWIASEVSVGAEADAVHSALPKDFIVTAGFCRLCHSAAPQRRPKIAWQSTGTVTTERTYSARTPSLHRGHIPVSVGHWAASQR